MQPAGYDGSFCATQCRAQLTPKLSNFSHQGWYAQATIGTNLTNYTNNTAEVMSEIYCFRPQAKRYRYASVWHI